MSRNENGSITLEAAMILPFFLLFVVFLATLIRIAVLEIALEETVSETTETVATHAYPATLIQESPRSLIDERLKGITMQQVSIGNIEKLTGFSLREFNIGTGGNFINSFTIAKTTPIIQDAFKEKVNDSIFKPDNLKVVDIEFPGSINGGEDSFFGMTIEYRMKAFIPFVDRELVLRKRAVERIWTGG